MVVGAVTTAWDRAHAAIAAMGDRFVLLRVDSTKNRIDRGSHAIDNTGSETQMREELNRMARGVIAGIDPLSAPTLNADEKDKILAAANLATLSRTAVEYAYNGDVIDSHAPELPTRFAKQLTQVFRGAVVIGLGRQDALRLAIRCARDSIPPLRLAIIDDLVEHPHSTTTEVRKRLEKPRNTIDRQLQALHMLGVVDVEEVEQEQRSRWHYSLADGINPDCLVPEIYLRGGCRGKEEREDREDRQEGSHMSMYISGTNAPPPPPGDFLSPPGGEDPSDCETCQRHAAYNPNHSCYYCGKPVRGGHSHCFDLHPLHLGCSEKSPWLAEFTTPTNPTKENQPA